jgi:hypothetical protein
MFFFLPRNLPMPPTAMARLQGATTMQVAWAGTGIDLVQRPSPIQILQLHVLLYGVGRLLEGALLQWGTDIQDFRHTLTTTLDTTTTTQREQHLL